MILVIIPKMSGFKSLNTKNLLKFVVFFQYVPRLLRIIPLYREVTRASGILTETAWAGAAFNLFLYMLASHVSLCYILSFTYIENEFWGYCSHIGICLCYLLAISGFTGPFFFSVLFEQLFITFQMLSFLWRLCVHA